MTFEAATIAKPELQNMTDVLTPPEIAIVLYIDI
jgi:hypothetical protein